MQFSVVSNIKFILAFLALICVQMSLAAPIPAEDAVMSRDVFVPLILEPNASAVWPIGTSQVVTWDVSRPPKQITNKHGRIVLRSQETGLLLLDQPLASGFDILLGEMEVVVPEVKPGTYQIVLFGNSGNWGEPFQIVGGQAPSEASSESN